MPKRRALGERHVLRQFGHQVDIQANVFRRGAHPASVALPIVEPDALADPALRHHCTDAIDHAGAVAAGHDPRILHCGRRAASAIGVRRVDPRRLEAHANFVAAGLGCRQFTADEHIPRGALPIVPNGAHCVSPGVLPNALSWRIDRPDCNRPLPSRVRVKLAQSQTEGGGNNVEPGLRPVLEPTDLDAGGRDSGRHPAGSHCLGQGQGACRRADRAGCGHSGGGCGLHHADGTGTPRHHSGHRHRLLSDRLDRPQCHLPLPPDRREGRLRDLAADHRRRYGRPQAAAAADRLLVRCVLRGRLGLRHAGRGDRRNPDRAWLLAAGGLGPVADRQYRTCRLRRARHTDRGACLGHRARSLSAGRHGGAPAAVLLADRAVLADLDLRRPARNAADLAGDPGVRRLVRHPAIPDLQLHQPMDRRYRRVADLDGLPDPVPEGLAAEGGLAVACAAHAR